MVIIIEMIREINIWYNHSHVMELFIEIIMDDDRDEC